MEVDESAFEKDIEEIEEEESNSAEIGLKTTLGTPTKEETMHSSEFMKGILLVLILICFWGVNFVTHIFYLGFT